MPWPIIVTLLDETYKAGWTLLIVAVIILNHLPSQKSLLS